MITRGDVSLDVEDSRGPDDWPQPTEVSTGFLQYSVHLPLDPKVRFESLLHHLLQAPCPTNLAMPYSKTIGGQEAKLLNRSVEVRCEF